MTETRSARRDNATTSTVSPAATVGLPAPDLQLTDTEGATVALSDLWSEKPLALVFLRHLGCTFCRQQLAWLRRDYNKFVDAGVQVACVAQGDPKVGKAYAIAMELPFPLLMCRDDLSVYQTYGLTRKQGLDLLTPNVIWSGLVAMLQGHRQTGIVGDGFQNGGAFVIDRAGSVRYAHPSADAADNITPATLLAEASKITGG